MDHEGRAAAAAAAAAALSESGHGSPNQDLKLSVWASSGITRCRKALLLLPATAIVATLRLANPLTRKLPHASCAAPPRGPT